MTYRSSSFSTSSFLPSADVSNDFTSPVRSLTSTSPSVTSAPLSVPFFSPAAVDSQKIALSLTAREP